MRKLRQFRVYFEQINQTYETVRVEDAGNDRVTVAAAVAKAKAKWRRESAVPQCISVEEDRS